MNYYSIFNVDRFEPKATIITTFLQTSDEDLVHGHVNNHYYTKSCDHDE